jgi:4'-phosphopantetheinyl transferase
MFINNPWNFNMAHSDDWIVCAVSKKAVGIDIECVDKVSGSKYIKQASEIFIENVPSLAYLSLLEESYFWTLRESYAKMKGLSFEQWINDVSFINKISGDVLSNEQHIFIKEFRCIKGYAITCCTYENIDSDIKMVQIDDLFK